ncbi:MAG: hypothetical protein D6776_03040 [Planctomycetota bacterium]|nr:MAG: hypothetical protein D6776_03040 [Planctomycetota bacterium]
MEAPVRSALKRAYRRLFRSDESLEAVLEELAASPIEPLREWAQFFRETRRGVIRRHQGPHGG